MAFAVAQQSVLSSQVSTRASAKRVAQACVVRTLPFRSATQRPRTIQCQVAAPVKEMWHVTIHDPVEVARADLPSLISRETVRSLEAELDNGAGVAALRRFNDNLRNIPADRWEAVLAPVFAELCFNLESFNPAFTACLLAVQRTIGSSDYVRRDMCLKNLIQPLAGEYGMSNNQPQLKTHRELFSDFFHSLFSTPLEALIASAPRPEGAVRLYEEMMRDLLSGGGSQDAVEKASYCLGYNLAIEYLADYEKTWMLDSFRHLDSSIFSPLGKNIDWVFLEVHAEGEAEHAAIGHSAVLNLIPAGHEAVVRKAMVDHDRDFATFYNRVADMLEC